MPFYQFLHFPLKLGAKSSVYLIRRWYVSNEMKILNVAEKNDAAKSIVGFLSNGNASKRQGASIYNMIYEFDYEIFGQRNKMVMTSVLGHLLDLHFHGNVKNWKLINPLILFETPVRLVCRDNNLKIKKLLEMEIKHCNRLIIWTDCDREGECIGYEIVKVCKKVNPNIMVHRAKFSEITRESVVRALANLTELDKAVVEAVNVRRELDLRIGAAFTRLQSVHLWKAFPEAIQNNIISYGSCQFPTLGFVVERFRAIAEFVPEKFWQINVKHLRKELSVDFSWTRNRLFDKQACQVLFDKCLQSKMAKVVDIKSKKKSKFRPRPLDTVEMMKQACRKLGLTGKQTLSVAEKLYTNGFISYPRTETDMFSKDINLVELVRKHVQDPAWGNFAQKVLNDGPNPFQGKKSDHAHPPIHPIQYTTSLQGVEDKLYKFIVRHFLACLSKHAEGLETVVEVEIAEERFVGKGLMIIAKNYLEVYPYETWAEKEMHVYTVGETFEPDISMDEGETTPPPLLTEADLLALMEKHGIGTDATHAEHIETIKSRFYVGLKNGKFFVPRTLGMGLVEAYSKMGYAMDKPNLRAELEQDLKLICENKTSPSEVLTKHLQKYKDVFQGVMNQMNNFSTVLQTYLGIDAKTVNAEESFSGSFYKCPSCKSAMIVREAKNQKIISCTQYPKCQKAFWFPYMVKELEILEETCPTCGPEVKLIRFKIEKGHCYLPTNYIGCIGGCDYNLLDVFNLNARSGRTTLVKSLQGRENQSSLLDDSGFQSIEDDIRLEEFPHCYCGVPAVHLVTRKEGPNKGKPFYKCANFSESCGFFQWAEKIENTISNVLKCNCGLPCRSVTATREGPNKGRIFYTCGKPYGEAKCDFFQWSHDKGTKNKRKYSTDPFDHF